MNKIKLIVVLSFFIQASLSQVTIEMDSDNGVYTIPCEVNGIPMKFVFDTGASGVTISSVEAKFLAKQDLLSQEDIIGVTKYQMANGEIEEGTKILLKEINVHGLILKDIEASVIKNKYAPLLLGQNVISKLGKIEIEGNRLTILSNQKIYFDNFLGVDFNKKFSDFNNTLSPYLNLKGEREGKLTPIKFQDLNIDVNHSLSRFNFGRQVVVFNSNEIVQMVILANERNVNTNTKAELNDLIEILISKYSQPNKITDRSAKWDFPEYQLVVTLNNGNTLEMVYGRKELQYNDKNVTIKNGKTLDKLRKDRTDFLTGAYKSYNWSHNIKHTTTLSYDDTQLQYTIEKNMMEIFPKKIRSYSEQELKGIQLSEDEFLKNTIRDLLNKETSVWILECEFKTIKVKGVFSYKKNKIREQTLNLRVANFFNLKDNYTKQDFNRILE